MLDLSFKLIQVRASRLCKLCLQRAPHRSLLFLCQTWLPNHLPSFTQSFDFSIVPGSEPCSSNLSLNSVPLDLAAPWSFEPNLVRGTTTLNASGHGLNVDWHTTCLDAGDVGLSSPASRLLTIAVNSIDGQAVSLPSTAGFTLSFVDVAPAQLVRLASPPVLLTDIDNTWTNPPEELRIDLSDFIENSEDPALKQHLDELHQLEAEADHLSRLIKDKKHIIAHHLVDQFKDNVHECDGVVCIVKAVFSHVHKGAQIIFQKFKPNPYSSITDKQGLTIQSDQAQNQAAMLAPSDNEKSFSIPDCPEKCHVKADKPGRYLPLPDESDERLPPQSPLDHIAPSKIWIVLKFFFIISGLAFIFALFRRCCASPRKRRDRAARREQRQRECEYKRAGRKQAFWDWMHGRKRGKPGRRPGDFDEKRALVEQQETFLEGQMEDEIRQLKIHEEIRQFRDTRDAVDELIRAEEGRGDMISAPPYTANPFESSPYVTAPAPPVPTYILGLTTIPQPITIPPRNYTSFLGHEHHQALISPASSSDIPFSPVSRTTSLPSYRSKPPSYREDDLSDSFSDSEGGAWTSSDDSSLPSLSPRPSGETIRTFISGETVRTFL